MQLSIFTSNQRKRKKAMASNFRVTLNGVNVTTRCQYFNTRTGRVLLLKRDLEGKAFLNKHWEIAKEWCMGKVRWERLK